jgi:hypothetical protein
MKTLFAVISYQGDVDNGNNQLIRETWGKDVKDDLWFFIGRRNSRFVPQADEALVDFQFSRKCQHAWWESYKDCCQDFWQVQARDILRWSLEQNYDFTYLCSTDTFLIPHKLMMTGFEHFDYSGYFIPEELSLGVRSTWDIYNEKRYAWADVGNGFFLSREASRIVLASPVDHQYTDQHIAQHLGPWIERKQIVAGRLQEFRNNISWHFRDQDGTGYQTHGSGWMRKMYQEHK